jgi:hypothetical protein
MNASGIFQTKALLEGIFDPTSGKLSLTNLFDETFDGVSLPYALYAVLVIADGQVVSWQDLTTGCTGPGSGIFPGQKFQLKPIALPAKKQKLQITVWGALN